MTNDGTRKGEISLRKCAGILQSLNCRLAETMSAGCALYVILWLGGVTGFMVKAVNKIKARLFRALVL
jgi:hypothetical protein